ncbi:MAG: helix-turn-helix transcriptional regulator [Candidatus Thiothrix moscowensis]|nr:helix-turn-helix transcriptional regulator [Candidatus Thiothrix moscowensis]
MKVELDPVAIGQRLREVRGDMSQIEFARRMGVTQTTITNYETGKRTPDVGFVVGLMNLFGTNPAWFISGQRESVERVSSDELGLLESYRKSGQQKGVIQTVAIAVANLEERKG